MSRPEAWPRIARSRAAADGAPTHRRLTALVGCTWPVTAMGVQEATGRGGIASQLLVDPEDLVLQVGRQRPDLCLVISPFTERLPELVTRLVEASRSTRTVVLAADERPPADVLAALREGASGWLPLGTDSDRLVDALQAVARGEAAVPRALMSHVLAELRGAAGREVVLSDGTPLELPPREHDVLASLAEGLSTTQVADALGIGVATVRGYVKSAVKRLGVPDRASAIALVSAAGGRRA